MTWLAIWIAGMFGTTVLSRGTVMDWTRFAVIVGWPFFALLWIVAVIGLASSV